MESYEQKLQRSMFSVDNEKTFIDKLLSRRDIEKVRELIRKERLDRSDLLELLYMCLGTEAKLLNLSDWDRYVLLKFFVWIREFIKIAELMFDNKEFLEQQEKEGKIVLSPICKQMLDHNERLMEHNAKFLVDLYLNISRTTLSVEGIGFLELLKNKFEMSYPQQQALQQPEKPRFWKFGGKKE